MKTVFLIDDDMDDREIFEEILLSLNMDVRYEEARNGADAVEKLNSGLVKKPDLIFLDLNMPVMDGRQFLTYIKQESSFMDIPVIIYSTSSNEEDRAYALKNKAALFMTKHYSSTQLEKDLRKTITDFLNF
ncbi:hypothetical protein ASE21_00115 [Flavobacterium sp. Root901]|uniref:response regulator n=1 Tax=Flavobacterium sp. Root901 TaxID=1736605 RepID=UPI0007108BB3|nr:response regulator [Flavobacterium sp. Root901]KRD12362.1 hypothetical protein ASE21_00115 [Flavobacterium sp. Root901]